MYYIYYISQFYVAGVLLRHCSINEQFCYDCRIGFRLHIDYYFHMFSWIPTLQPNLELRIRFCALHMYFIKFIDFFNIRNIFHASKYHFMMKNIIIILITN